MRQVWCLAGWAKLGGMRFIEDLDRWLEAAQGVVALLISADEQDFTTHWSQPSRWRGDAPARRRSIARWSR